MNILVVHAMGDFSTTRRTSIKHGKFLETILGELRNQGVAALQSDRGPFARLESGDLLELVECRGVGRPPPT